MIKFFIRCLAGILLVNGGWVLGQEKHEPAVLFLYTNNVVMSDNIREEVSVYDKEIEITDEVRKGYVQDNLSQNWKIIRNKELEFIKKQDFATLLLITLSRELAYKEIENHENLLIYAVKETATTDKAQYKALTDKHKMSWLVNIPTVELIEEGGTKRLVLTVQLYNAKTGWLFLDTSYKADSSEIDLTACEEGIWYCLIQKIKIPITRDVADKVDRNRHHHK